MLFKRDAGADVTVISQAAEGNFAFEAVAMKLSKENRRLSKNDLVFDIGGGSFQLVGQ
ncbi:MAG: hypothetical protein MRQ09_05190 [Candidatus Midichloria sp.]|nr:hypothetical protein [Candidatus Midichloria sp.]